MKSRLQNLFVFFQIYFQPTFTMWILKVNAIVKNYLVFYHSSKNIPHTRMVYDGFGYYFLSTCQVDYQGDLVVYYIMLAPLLTNEVNK
jgi:hypothetical protein